MTTPPATQTKGFLLFRRAIIIVLAGLLIFYHSLTLYEMYLGNGNGAHTLFDHVQSVFRVLITISLLLVVLGVRWALWGVWLSISGLVATHYWAHFGNLPVDFTEGRQPLPIWRASSCANHDYFVLALQRSAHAHRQSLDLPA